MKDALRYFIDIERFVQWTFTHKDLFYKDDDDTKNKYKKLFSDKIKRNWRTYTKFPLGDTLNEVNKHLDKDCNGKIEKDKPFEMISIAELIICINNAKDHPRGKKNPDCLPITSTGKKLMNILLLGGIISDINYNFRCSVKNHHELYKYLKMKHCCAGEVISYFPGRTVSAKQIDNALEKYKNRISYRGIIDGLNQLSKIGLVEIIDDEKQFYKLNFDCCKKFVQDSLS